MENRFLLMLLPFLCLNSLAQVSRVYAIQSKITTQSTTENSSIIPPKTSMVNKGTIFFNENGTVENINTTLTSGICSVFLFETVSEAQIFAGNLKNSDANISDFSFTGVKNNRYYFTFSLLQSRDMRWYLQLFKNNNLLYVNYNNKTQSIENALSE